MNATTPTEWILGSLLISIIAGAIGNIIGSSGKVDLTSCNERRNSCTILNKTVIDNIYREIQSINEKLDDLSTRGSL